MFEAKRASVKALTWDIWSRNRTPIACMLGLTLLGCLVTFILRATAPEDILKPGAGRMMFEGFAFTVSGAAFLLVFAVFGCSEFNAQDNSSGFPKRLFTLPVSSFELISVPMLSGVLVMELIYWIKIKYVFGVDEHVALFAVLFGLYIVLHQFVWWTLGRFGPLRLIIEALIAFVLYAVALMAGFPGSRFNEADVIGVFAGIAVALFFVTWFCIARQRCGATQGRSQITRAVRALLDQIGTPVPLRARSFDSAAAAQTWFEWKRSGYVLPLLVAALLLTVIGPFSWYVRNDAADSLRILVAVLMLPLILALPVGKAFSKPDFWSGDLKLSSLIAVRPISSTDLIEIKLKVALRSASLAWVVTLAFMSVWLSVWANTDLLTMIRAAVWQISGHNNYLQFEIAGSSLLAGLFLTWKFLVSSLWLGLSGKQKLFAASAIPYAVVPFFVMAALIFLSRHDQSTYAWIRRNTHELLPSLELAVAATAIGKFWFSARSWRASNFKHLRRYVTFWGIGTVVLLGLAFQLPPILQFFLPADSIRIRNLLILVSLVMIPLGRIGLAPALLESNRHR